MRIWNWLKGLTVRDRRPEQGWHQLPSGEQAYVTWVDRRHHMETFAQGQVTLENADRLAARSEERAYELLGGTPVEKLPPANKAHIYVVFVQDLNGDVDVDSAWQHRDRAELRCSELHGPAYVQSLRWDFRSRAYEPYETKGRETG